MDKPSFMKHEVGSQKGWGCACSRNPACKKGTTITETVAQFPANWKLFQNGIVLVGKREKIEILMS